MDWMLNIELTNTLFGRNGFVKAQLGGVMADVIVKKSYSRA